MATKKKPDDFFKPSSVQDAVAKLVVSIYGPPDVGKTVAACSASSFWPKDPTTNKKKIILKDVLHVGWDTNALLPLAPWNIHVPYHVDMSTLIAECHGNFATAVNKLLSKYSKLLWDTPEIKFAIHDTVTTMDQQSRMFCFDPAYGPTSKHTGEIITKQAWGMHQYNHMSYQTATMNCPPGVSTIYTFHEAVIDTPKEATDSQKTKDKMRRFGRHDVNIRPAITGSGDNFYCRSSNFELAMSATAVPGKKGVLKRWFHPYVDDRGRRTKNKFAGLLDQKMPANLGELLEKARKL